MPTEVDRARSSSGLSWLIPQNPDRVISRMFCGHEGPHGSERPTERMEDVQGEFYGADFAESPFPAAKVTLSETSPH
jgi:hypothetical protein